MTRTDPFSAVMGERRGRMNQPLTGPPESAPPLTPDAGTAERPPRETGVSSSGLPFQAASREDAILAVKACATALRCKPSANQYEQWYYAELAWHAHGQASRRPPSARTVIRRVGTWRQALQAAGF